MSGHDASPPKIMDSTYLVEVGLCVVLTVLFAFMFVHSFEWDIEAALFPRVISAIGILSMLAYLAQITWKKLGGQSGPAQRVLDIAWTKVEGDQREVRNAAIGVVLWAVAFWIAIVLVSFHVAAPLYLYCQLVIYGKVRKWVAALSAAAAVALIVLVYDRLAGTTWNDPILFDLAKELIGKV